MACTGGADISFGDGDGGKIKVFVYFGKTTVPIPPYQGDRAWL